MDSIAGQPRISKVPMDSVNCLRDLGLSDFDLPRVALVGMRNAKADILEAILGFKVDNSRHACSVEYRLSRSRSPWSCKIFIRVVSEDNGPLENVSIIPLGDVISNKDHVQMMMKRAQVAVLNPSMPIANVLSMQQDELENYIASNFSLSCPRNVVCVELSSKNLTDLTLIDLPDVDFSFEIETRKAVENTILAQLQGKCLIVATVPMNEDIFCKRALYLAKRADPDGVRTIGVLTNFSESGTPDCHEYALQLGYCRIAPRNEAATKNKRPTEKDTATTVTSSHSGQNSSERLSDKLSSLLHELIQETMPLLRVDVVNCLDQCRQEIASLPAAVTEPATYMLVILTQLSEDMRQIINGTCEVSPLLKLTHGFYADLSSVIGKTAPNFVPVLHSGLVNQDIINHLAGDVKPGERAVLGSPFCLDDMRKHIAAYAARDLSNHIPQQARKALISSFQSSWPSHVSQCLEGVVGSMVKVIVGHIQAVCQNRELLAEHLRSLLGELIRHHLNVCSEYLEAILEIELTPYTQHQSYLNSHSEEWLSKYYDIRKGRIGAKQAASSTFFASKPSTSMPQAQERAKELKVPSEATTATPQPTGNKSNDRAPQPPSTSKPDAPLHNTRNELKASTAPDPKTGSSAETIGSLFSFKNQPLPPKPTSLPRNPTLPAQSIPTFFSSNTTASTASVPPKPDFFGSKATPSATPSQSLPPNPDSLGSKSTPSVAPSQSLPPKPDSLCSNTAAPAPPPRFTFGHSGAAKVSSTSGSSSPATSDSKTNPPQEAQKAPTLSSLPFPFSPDCLKSTANGSNVKKTADNSVKDSFPSDSGASNAPKSGWPSTASPNADYQIALAALSRLGFTGLTKADLGKLSRTDEYEEELQLMAGVRGYFQIAYMRVVDYVPALIEHKFVRAIGSDILPFFMEKMGLGRPNANAICATYFAEDPTIAAKRAALADLHTRLERAQLEFFKLGL